MFNTEQLFIRFRSIVDNAVCLMAKSTPLTDRRCAVVEALCMAAQDCEPGFGDMETYIGEASSSNTLEKVPRR